MTSHLAGPSCVDLMQPSVGSPAPAPIHQAFHHRPFYANQRSEDLCIAIRTRDKMTLNGQWAPSHSIVYIVVGCTNGKVNGGPHPCQSREVNCYTLSKVRPDKRIFTVQHDEWVTFLSCDQHVLERAGTAAAAGPHAEDSTFGWLEQKLLKSMTTDFCSC